jgi:hypothetical protein
MSSICTAYMGEPPLAGFFSKAYKRWVMFPGTEVKLLKDTPENCPRHDRGYIAEARDRRRRFEQRPVKDSTVAAQAKLAMFDVLPLPSQMHDRTSQALPAMRARRQRARQSGTRLSSQNRRDLKIGAAERRRQRYGVGR